MKAFVNYVSWGLGFLGFLFLVLPTGWFPEYYDVRYFGFASIFGVLVIQLVPEMFQVRDGEHRAASKNNAASQLQVLLTFFVLGNAAGDLGLYQLYKVGFEYDKFLHFAIPLAAAIVLPSLAHERFGVRISRAIPLILGSIIFFGLFWELYEFLVDRIWGTRLYGLYGTKIMADTRMDIVCNVAGACVGSILAYYRSRSLPKG